MKADTNVFVGGYAVKIVPAPGGAQAVMAQAAAVPGKGAPRLPGTSCNQVFGIKHKHKHVHKHIHLKTKRGWVINWVPPQAGLKFFAARQLGKAGGKRRFWGFVTFDNKKHYGWIDEVHLTKFKTKLKQKWSSMPDLYEEYRQRIRRLMKRAWRYRNPPNDSELHKRPVNALIRLPSTVQRVSLYKNRKANDENLAYPVDRHDPHGFHFAVRYATDKWILVAPYKHVEDHEWYFLNASYDDVELNPGHPQYKKWTETLTHKKNKKNKKKDWAYLWA